MILSRLWRQTYRFRRLASLTPVPSPFSGMNSTPAFSRAFAISATAFGARRCMFESNFPVEKGSQSYVVLWNACKLLAARAAADEKAALF
jgi:predicted TIM-barrel fold metal-dependent hydrolase